MSALPIAPQNDDVTVPKTRRVALAFQAIFGQSARRSADQKLVVDHLREMCGRDSPIFRAAGPGQPFDPLAAAHRDGAQTQYLIIKRQLAIARKLATGEKRKVTVKKGKDE